MRQTPPVTYFVPGEGTSPKWASAFAEGCGGRTTPITHPGQPLAPGAFAAFCTPPTWPLLQRAQADGRDTYYGDHGLFRRGQYYRVTKNAYQPDGEGAADSSRWDALGVPLSDGWKCNGRHIVICPNSPVYMKFHGFDANAWVADLIQRLTRHTDRPIIARWKTDAKERPLSVDLQDAWMVVAFSSAAAVEALAAGVPVCTLAPWASTVRMGIIHVAQVEYPYYPDLDLRDQFLFNLAAAQWTLAEMRQGLAWKALQGDVVHA